MQRKEQSLGADAVGVPGDRQQRHERGQRSREVESPAAADCANARRSAPRLDAHAVVAGVGQEQQVGGLVVEARSAERPQDHHLARARVDRARDGDLEVRLVLRHRVRRHRHALPGEAFDAGLAERVHVADHQVRKDPPALEGQRAAVSGHDEIALPDDRAVAGQQVPVRDHHGPHRGQKKSGA